MWLPTERFLKKCERDSVDWMMKPKLTRDLAKEQTIIGKLKRRYARTTASKKFQQETKTAFKQAQQMKVFADQLADRVQFEDDLDTTQEDIDGPEAGGASSSTHSELSLAHCLVSVAVPVADDDVD